LVFAQGAHSRTLDCGHVDKGVVAAAVRLDETIAFAFVEEFYGSDGHWIFLPSASPKVRAASR
jgi:hypothetical protein